MTGGDVGLEAVRRSGGVNGKVLDEFTSTGAVVAGRGTFELAGGWAATTTTTRPSSSSATNPASTAKEAAGDKNVLVHGAGTAQLGTRRRASPKVACNTEPRSTDELGASVRS